MRIQLYVVTYPIYRLEAFVSFNRPDGAYERTVAFVDTGAQVSLFPNTLLDRVENTPIADGGTIELEQAGIAGQVFTATEAFITLRLEDMQGNRTQDLSIRAWFANTSVALLGWRDLLEMGILHVDAPQRHATFELNPA